MVFDILMLTTATAKKDKTELCRVDNKNRSEL
jgi:hypothetical protein